MSTPFISVQGLTRRFPEASGKGELTVFEDLWFGVEEGELAFGDGIMSAIDFDMEIERLPNPKGDRVKITMSGKFLPYKYYGNEQGILEYGVKEA